MIGPDDEITTIDEELVGEIGELLVQLAIPQVEELEVGGHMLVHGWKTLELRRMSHGIHSDFYSMRVGLSPLRSFFLNREGLLALESIDHDGTAQMLRDEALGLEVTAHLWEARRGLWLEAAQEWEKTNRPFGL